MLVPVPGGSIAGMCGHQARSQQGLSPLRLLLLPELVVAALVPQSLHHTILRDSIVELLSLFVSERVSATAASSNVS